MKSALARRVSYLVVLTLIPGVLSGQIPLGSEFRVNSYTTSVQWGASVAADDAGRFVIAWAGVGDDAYFAVRARRYGSSGAPEGSEFLVSSNPGFGENPSIAATGRGAFVVAWDVQEYAAAATNTDVFARQFPNGQNPHHDDFRVNTATTFRQSFAAVSLDATGDFVVVWQSYDVTTSGDESLGIWARRFSHSGKPAGDEFEVDTRTSGLRITPAVAMSPRGAFVVAWAEDMQDGSGFGVFARRFARSGDPAGDEFQVNTTTVGTQYVPRVAFNSSGDFVIVWESGRNYGPIQGIFGQRYASDGSTIGGEFRVNQYTTGFQLLPAVAFDASGAFVVTWTSMPEDGSYGGIFGRLFSSTGLPASSEFRVNSFTTDDQIGSSIAMDGRGNFIVAWTSNGFGNQGQDGGDAGVFAQRFRVDQEDATSTGLSSVH